MGPSGGDDKKKAHLLAIPIPHSGHLLPMLRFTTGLASKGITITIVIYENLVANLAAKGFLSEVQDLDFRIISLANPWGPTENIPVLDAKNLQESFQPVLEKLLQDKSTDTAGPTSILSDMFLSWSQELSEKLEIPWYMFIPSGAAFARIMQEAVWLFAQKQFRVEADGTLCKYEGTLDVPGLSPMQYHELVFSARLYPNVFLLRSQVMCQAAGIVLNTWYELEEKVIESMSSPAHPEFEAYKVGKIYAVGPLFISSVSLRGIAVNKELNDSADESIIYLKAQPPCSVLYVAFGTMAQLTAGEIHELALGLEDSNTRFLWVLPQRKDTPSVKDLLPSGFEARVGDRGHIVTGWAPQPQILAHSATGGFLTHAGWNSSMESVTLGVPMIIWPQWAEQHLNCRYLVDELKIADQIRTGPENILDRKEIARAVRVLMVGPEGKEMRRRVQELQRTAAEAVAEGGSMSRAIDQFAHDVSAPGYPKRA